MEVGQILITGWLGLWASPHPLFSSISMHFPWILSLKDMLSSPSDMLMSPISQALDSVSSCLQDTATWMSPGAGTHSRLFPVQSPCCLWRLSLFMQLFKPEMGPVLRGLPLLTCSHPGLRILPPKYLSYSCYPFPMFSGLPLAHRPSATSA